MYLNPVNRDGVKAMTCGLSVGKQLVNMLSRA